MSGSTGIEGFRKAQCQPSTIAGRTLRGARQFDALDNLPAIRRGGVERHFGQAVLLSQDHVPVGSQPQHAQVAEFLERHFSRDGVGFVQLGHRDALLVRARHTVSLYLARLKIQLSWTTEEARRAAWAAVLRRVL
jgi:hypothetical protein